MTAASNTEAACHLHMTGALSLRLRESEIEMMSNASELKPKSGVRRFDVFAEYTRQEREEKGYPEDEAKGYGIWLAKVVAARRFGQHGKSEGSKARRKLDAEAGGEEQEPKFRSVGDELQTDELFDRDIIGRMGARFYDEVFVPAITEARQEGKSYETVRDSIRQEWKPVKRGAGRGEGEQGEKGEPRFALKGRRRSRRSRRSRDGTLEG